mgnify:CR=1 FL=1
MSTSPSLEPSISSSRSEYLSSLPRWRRWLSRLNWHPVVDLELQTEQIKSETERLRNENARYAELNAKIAALLFSSDTSSPPQPPTPNKSPT